MHLIVRRTILAVALIPVLLALSLTPASAATVRVGKSAVPNTLPSAALTTASVTFTTRDEDKDDNSAVQITIITNTSAIAATTFGTYGHFDDGSTHGPFPLAVTPGITAANLSTGLIRMDFETFGDDTWRFNYSITMGFSDGTSFIFRDTGKSLDQNEDTFLTPFAYVTQVAVPDVTDESQAAATSTLQAAGLTVGSVTHRTDSTCEHVNVVWTESPRAGTIVNPGTAVSLVIGDKPKICD